MNSKIKKALPYIILNTAGAIVILLCFFVRPLAGIGFYFAFLIQMLYQLSPLGLIVIIALVLALNAAAFLKAEGGKPEPAILCSVFFGSLGGFTAVHTVNKGFEGTRSINIIFNVHLWISAYLAVSWLLYSFGYYSFTIWR